VNATAAVLAAAATLLLSGCTREVDGNLLASSELRAAHSTSAAMPTTTPPAEKPIPLDRLVAASVRSTALFWQTLGVDVDVEPMAVAGKPTCAGTVYPSAVFCPTTTYDLVKYRISEMEYERAQGGDLAVRITMAHEVGHAAALAQYGALESDRPSSEAELSADCAAGAALADAGVDRNEAQTSIRATALGLNGGGYGFSGYQRVTAFFAGFDGDVSPMGCLSYEG
jgi:predicted metalloprotease